MHYLRNLLLFIVSLFLLAGALNAFVDPYGFYWSPTFEGFNARKTQADERVREVTPYRALELQPDTLLIGSSRVQLGFAAESDSFGERSVFNLALPGSGLTENLKYALLHVKQNPNLRTLIIGVDYRYFLNNYGNDPGPWTTQQLMDKYNKNPETTVEKIQRIYPALFSLDTLQDSFATVIQQRGLYNHITRLGSNTGDYYLATIKAEGKQRFFTHQQSGVQQRFEREQYRYRGEHGLFGIGMYQTFIDELVAKHPNVTLYTFINPYHQSYWRVIKQTGHWPDYLQWKRDLAALADMYPQFPFYDFSLPSVETLEDPDYAKNREPMVWFWEPAHYRPAMGDRIIETMFASEQENADWPIRLTGNNINRAIAQSEAGLSAKLTGLD
ncbi:hypothetical protein [Alteromonas sp. AMM-1]|uniref:hypothetical protein n=1 Tax=Alteromonas sp. AMM-1 TaxID=3394233 RepID=UPI0039A60EA6